MPYQKPSVLTERTGLPGTPLGITNYFIPVAIAETLGKPTGISRLATATGDSDSISINGTEVAVGDTLTYSKVAYTDATKVTAALPELPVVGVTSVSTDTTNPFKKEYVENTDFTIDKVTGILNFAIAGTISAPEVDDLTEGVTGSITAATYDFTVIATDANDNSTIPAIKQSLTVAGGTATVTVRWGHVQNASGYLVYAKPTSVDLDDWALVDTITSGTTTSAVLTADIVAGAVDFTSATNDTKHTPADGANVYINFTYAVSSYNSPKRYFDTETLQAEHGIGSELANAGRLIIGPAGVGNAAGSMYAVAPNTTLGSITGYQAAIGSCESIQELVLMSTASTSDTVNETLVAHCADMSSVENARERFCFVSTTSTVMQDTDVSVITNKILALNGSNRCSYVVTDGGTPYLDSWQNTIDKYNSQTATTKTTPYTNQQAVSGAWHALATMGMVTALTDPATPATNKQVLGINSGEEGTVSLWNDTKKDTIAANGGWVLEDRLNNLFVRQGLTISLDSVEDSESSIVMAGAYMAKVLRDNHAKFIGNKLTEGLVAGVAKTVKDTLDGLVSAEIITRYNSVNVYQDTTNPTWVYVLFNYFPIYPTNVIKFEWGFDIAG